MKKNLILLVIIAFFRFENVQGETIFTPSDTLNETRLNSFLIASGVGLTGTIVGLNELWYADHARSSFHFQDDIEHWQGMDKLGHATTAYWMGYYGMQSLNWAGVSRNRAVWYGGMYGLPFLTAVEVLDGFSEAWGFSPSDQAANVLGAALLIGQEKAWQEQRFQLKFSFSASGLAEYRPELLGSNFIEESLKDYNAQTYWLSFSANKVVPGSPLPDWLNISPGYSGNNMLGSVQNPSVNSAGETLPKLERHPQFYLSLDVNWLNVEVENPYLNNLINALAFIKIPFPAMEYNRKEGIEAHWLYF